MSQVQKEGIKTPKEEKMLEQALGAIVNLDKKVDEISEEFKALKEKVELMKNPQDEYKTKVKQEDVNKAQDMRKDLGDEINNVINSVLGKDFGARIDPNGVSGTMLTIIVPSRVSILEGDKIDERSVALAPGAGKLEVTEFCEKVRRNIVETYNKLQRPLPELSI